MSDDEALPMDGVGGAGMGDDDMSDDGDMGDRHDDMYKPPAELPEGVTKEIVTAAPAGGDHPNWKKPKEGDEVTVHYVGTLLSDGSEFDSSRSRNKPFEFTLGKGQVIQGWDLGVATMKKGEVAKFTLAPEFAYGDDGSPPKIPAKATLVFEVELISWASKDDLFGDEGVIKTQLTEGKGWKSPKAGEEVLLALKIEKPDGTIIVEKADLEYVIGSGSLGGCVEACEKALAGMKRGEEVTLTCSKEYADSLEGGATVSLTVKEMFETKDVSFEKNGTLMKKQVMEGEGYDTPNESATVKLSVTVATDGAIAIPSFTPKVLEFIAGNGDVCDALESAVVEMKKGEGAVLTVTNPSVAAEAQLGLKGIAGDKVVLHMELLEFEKSKESYDMDEDEKVQFGVARKDVGAAMFKSGRLGMALQRYKKVGDLFNYIDNFKDEKNKDKAKELKKACELNKAACYIKLKDFPEAKKSCDAVLKDEVANVKAIYRRAQAQCGLKNFQECIRDCKRVVELDAQNKDARTLLKQAQLGQKEEDKKSKGLFANMCKALGKGPIPEPFVAKKEADDMDDEDDEDEEDDAPMDGEEASGKDVEMKDAADKMFAAENKTAPADASA